MGERSWDPKARAPSEAPFQESLEKLYFTTDNCSN